jgi:hypothetical protein
MNPKQHKTKQGKGTPVPFNPIPGLDAVTEVTAEVVTSSDAVATNDLPAIPGRTDQYRTHVRAALAELVKASSIDILSGPKGTVAGLTEDQWLAWADDVKVPLGNTKALAAVMEAKVIGEAARRRMARPDQRGGDNASKSESKSNSEKQTEKKLKLIAEHEDLYQAYCEKQAKLTRTITIGGAATAITAALKAADPDAATAAPTENKRQRQERLNEEAIAELSHRETSFKTVGEAVAFAMEHLVKVYVGKDTVANADIKASIATAEMMVNRRKERAEAAAEEAIAKNLAAAQAS